MINCNTKPLSQCRQYMYVFMQACIYLPSLKDREIYNMFDETPKILINPRIEKTLQITNQREKADKGLVGSLSIRFPLENLPIWRQICYNINDINGNSDNDNNENKNNNNNNENNNDSKSNNVIRAITIITKDLVLIIVIKVVIEVMFYLFKAF